MKTKIVSAYIFILCLSISLTGCGEGSGLFGSSEKSDKNVINQAVPQPAQPGQAPPVQVRADNDLKIIYVGFWSQENQSSVLEVRPEEVGNILFRITNLEGGAIEDAPVEIVFDNRTYHYEVDIEEGGEGFGSHRNVSFDEPGDHRIEFFLNRDREIPEQDYNNNYVSMIVHVLPPEERPDPIGRIEYFSEPEPVDVVPDTSASPGAEREDADPGLQPIPGSRSEEDYGEPYSPPMEERSQAGVYPRSVGFIPDGRYSYVSEFDAGTQGTLKGMIGNRTLEDAHDVPMAIKIDGVTIGEITHFVPHGGAYKYTIEDYTFNEPGRHIITLVVNRTDELSVTVVTRQR